ncbi:MAG: ATPase domain-containing protein [Candidatus Micrarchaeota archaeon]
MERRFIKSGIDGLDNVLGGGILEGSIITVSGPTGAGKSTFAAQFLHNGAVQSDEPGLYISIEESRRDFFFHMGGFEMDFAALERDRKFILLDYPIHEVDQIINQSGSIQEIINSTGVKRVVIDSIMPIALYFKGEDERKKGFLKFIENLRKWNVTTMIVSEDLKIHSGSRPSSEFGIESFTDGWINLFYRYDDRTMERSRFVEVVKMKGVAHSSRSYPATLSRKGFAISSGQSKPSEAKPPAPAPPTEKKEVEKAGRTLRMVPPEKPKAPAAAPAKGSPAKMTPALAARLAEAKNKIMKKK